MMVSSRALVVPCALVALRALVVPCALVAPWVLVHRHALVCVMSMPLMCCLECFTPGDL